MRSTGSFILGALLGGILGAVAALVLAPSSGDKLRGQIRGYVGDFRSEITQAAADRRTQLEQQLARMRSAGTPQP